MKGMDLLASLRDQAAATLRPAVADGRPCAIVGYPNHGNAGDSAIWLGTMNWLANEGVRIAYKACASFYDADRLRAACPDGPIYLNGGGNLGDLWKFEHGLRERVMRDFPDRTIVQLPQSVSFRTAEGTKTFKEILDRQHDFTCFVRDEESKRRYEEAFGRPATLCTDMALLLPSMERVCTPSRDALYLIRDDAEGRFAGTTPSPAWTRNFATPKASVLVLAAFAKRVLRLPLPMELERFLTSRYDAVSAQRLEQAKRLLSSGSVVVTDRLHGHLLCLLMGIPHVSLDNSYGKVHSFIRAWTASSPLVRLATTLEEADDAARELLAGN